MLEASESEAAVQTQWGDTTTLTGSEVATPVESESEADEYVIVDRK